jgi:hypothetical protein
MTKTDYRLIASEINRMVSGLEQDFSKHHLGVIREFVNNLSDKMLEQNRHFDRDIFAKACGL